MLTLYCLGNPTLKHKQNRHNAGLLLGDYLVNRLDLNLKKFKHYKLSNTFQIDGTQCQIALSENYMNESGNGVLSLKTTKLSKSEELFVLYDELAVSYTHLRAHET